MYLAIIIDLSERSHDYWLHGCIDTRPWKRSLCRGGPNSGRRNHQSVTWQMFLINWQLVWVHGARSRGGLRLFPVLFITTDKIWELS